jgi:hypothetical protein
MGVLKVPLHRFLLFAALEADQVVLLYGSSRGDNWGSLCSLRLSLFLTQATQGLVDLLDEVREIADCHAVVGHM